MTNQYKTVTNKDYLSILENIKKDAINANLEDLSAVVVPSLLAGIAGYISSQFNCSVDYAPFAYCTAFVWPVFNADIVLDCMEAVPLMLDYIKIKRTKSKLEAKLKQNDTSKKIKG